VIPEGLRDVIGKRLSMLSPDCNKLLSIASVIGREFAIDILRTVAGISEEAFVAALKEAVQVSVLEERSQLGSIRYRFTHAFFRQTMYEELIAPQRLRLHKQVALALETRYAKRIEEHAAELGEHFSQSTDSADLAKAVSYGEIAAQRAVAVFAYGEAVRLLEQALKVQRVLDPNDKGRVCDLLLALGDYLTLAGDPQRAFATELQEAFSIAECMGDKTRAARACSLAIRGLFHYGAGGPASWAVPEAAQWMQRADRCAAPDTPEGVWANVGVASMKTLQGTLSGRFDLANEGYRLLVTNLELARRLNDPEAFLVAVMNIVRLFPPQHSRILLKLAEELAHESRGKISASIFGAQGFSLGHLFLAMGRRSLAEQYFTEYKQGADRSRQAYVGLGSMTPDGTLATLDGRLEDAVAIGQNIFARGEQLGYAQAANILAVLAAYTALLHLGRIRELPDLFKAYILSQDPIFRACFRADVGQDTAEVVKVLEQYVVNRPGIGSADDGVPFFLDMFLLRAALRVGHLRAAELLLHRFASSGLHTTGTYFPTCIPRHLGAAAALLGRHEEARKHYDEALKVCTEMRFRPELALTRLQLAELLLEHYPAEKTGALEHLDFAIKEFREMKMQPSLERALKLV